MAARNRAARAKRQAAAAGTSPLQWSEANLKAAHDEGWALVRTPQSKRWLRHYEHAFYDRGELHGYLVQRALEGSALAVKVLAILYAHNKDEFLAVLKARPANETGKLVKNVIVFARVAGAIQGEQ